MRGTGLFLDAPMLSLKETIMLSRHHAVMNHACAPEALEAPALHITACERLLPAESSLVVFRDVSFRAVAAAARQVFDCFLHDSTKRFACVRGTAGWIPHGNNLPCHVVTM